MAQVNPTPSGSNLTPEEQARLDAMRRASVGATGPSAPIGEVNALNVGYRPNVAPTNNPNNLPPAAPGQSVQTYQAPASLYNQATSGGPPPGFTGTFAGKQYVNGQPASGGYPASGPNEVASGSATDVSGIAGLPAMQRAAAAAAGSGGSVGPAVSSPASAPIATGGSVAPALAPRPAPASAAPLTTAATTPASASAAPINATEAASQAAPLENQNPSQPGTEQGAGAGSGDLGAITNSIMSQLQSISQGLANPGTQSDVTGVFLQQSQAILAMLDDQEKQLRAENEKAGTTMDPATQFTLDKLRQNLEDNIKATREDLNRRGILESGIELELQNRLQKGSASDQAMILADRLSKLQDQLSQGLSSIRSQKVSTLSSFGQAAAGAQFTANENSKQSAQQREQAALQGMLNLRGQVASSQDSAMARAAAAAQSQAALEQNASQFQQTYDQNAQQYANPSGYQQAQIDLQRQQFAADQAAAQSAGRSSGGGGTGAAPRAAAPASAPAQATAAPGDPNAQATQALFNNFQTPEERAAFIQQNREALAKYGANPDQLLQNVRNF